MQTEGNKYFFTSLLHNRTFKAAGARIPLLQNKEYYSSKPHRGWYIPAFPWDQILYLFSEAQMNTDVFPACKLQINLPDLYDAKTMYLDCVSSHCYCLLVFPLICPGRSRKTFPFSGHHVHLPFPHPPIPAHIHRRIKRVEWSHKKPCGNTQQILHEDFWRFLRNKPLVQIA